MNQSCWTPAADAERGGELMQRCTEQLARIQSALTTREFVRRVSDATRGSAEVRLLRDEQAALLDLAEDFLVETMPQPAVVGWSAVRS
ncbi:MAG: hypothetical protein M5U09_19370 [Gammaproteobacteria bacterium]|nr:hypothetical protein [Gammaproteobacteria bacterium]